MSLGGPSLGIDVDLSDPEALSVAGKRVGSAEVVEELLSHPAVADAATIWVPDETGVWRSGASGRR